MAARLPLSARDLELWRLLNDTGGFTASMSGLPQSTTTGYVVAYAGFEAQISWRLLTPPMFRMISGRYQYLAGRGGTYWGAWHDKENDVVYFDLSMICGSKEAALVVARVHNQREIYDFASKTGIEVT